MIIEVYLHTAEHRRFPDNVATINIHDEDGEIVGTESQAKIKELFSEIWGEPVYIDLVKDVHQ